MSDFTGAFPPEGSGIEIGDTAEEVKRKLDAMDAAGGAPAGDDSQLDEVLAALRSKVRHPDVTVHLSTGVDGNIGAIMARITEGLRAAGYADEQDEFRAEIFNASSYDHALRICMLWVNVT